MVIQARETEVVSKFVPLYEQVARRIERQIEAGKFQPGERVYTIRAICAEFGVSDITAKKAMEQLNARGVVRSVPGSGAYVQDRGAAAAEGTSTQQLVAFLKIGLKPPLVFTHEIDLIQRELFSHGFNMTYTVAETDDSMKAVLDQISESHPRGLIVFPPHHPDFNVNNGPMTLVRKTGLPVLVIETISERDAFIATDIQGATEDLVNHLYDLGHRRICMTTDYAPKREGFKKAVARINDPKLRAFIHPSPPQIGHATHQQADEILAMSPRPTGIIAGDDHSTALLISHFQSRGLSVPQDISVVGFDDHPQLGVLSPVPATAVRHPSQEVAQEAAAWVLAQVAGRPGAGRSQRLRRLIRGTFIMRDSSGPPPAD